MIDLTWIVIGFIVLYFFTIFFFIYWYISDQINTMWQWLRENDRL